MLKVRLFRPFSAQHLLALLPASVGKIAVLDRTKEPGALAEPLYLDVMTALAEAYSRGDRDTLPKVIGGRYGLSSKEFGPHCVLAIFRELSLDLPRPRFTVGIFDDVTGLSLPLSDEKLNRAQHWKPYFMAWEVMVQSLPPRITSRLSATAPHSTLKVILFTIRRRLEA